MPLSQVLAYNTEHLVDAAAHWQGLADQREEVFASVRNEAWALPWEGQAADATHQRTQSDHDTAMQSAERLRSAAMIAKDGASTLDQMHSRTLYTIEDAQADGFAPTEPLIFVDTRPTANPAELAQRQQQALAYTGQLQSQVADLVNHDTQVGADMHNATAGEGKIQFVDHTFKTDNSGGDQPTLGSGEERPMPDIGGEHIGGGGGQTPLEEGLGGPPGPSPDWWKNTPAPAPPTCSLNEFGGDVVDTAGATAGEIGLAAATPGEGPLAILGGIGLIAGAKTVGSDIEKTIDCIDKGIG